MTAASDAQGNEISGEAVSWSSNFPEVATVAGRGRPANGRATVTVTGVSGTATVNVDQRADSVDIAPGEVELNSVGETALLTLRAIDANGHEAPGGGDLTSWRWRSADPNVATVSPVPVITLEAEVQAVAAGTTTVTVTAVTEDGGSLSATAQVTVELPSELQDQGKPDLEIRSLGALQLSETHTRWRPSNWGRRCRMTGTGPRKRRRCGFTGRWTRRSIRPTRRWARRRWRGWLLRRTPARQ